MSQMISLEEEFLRISGGADYLGDPAGEPAYLYARSSALTQALEGHESLSRQLLFGHEKALANGLRIPLDMTYWDVWDGKDTERPEFLRMLSDIKREKRSDVLYVDQTSRLSRDVPVYYVLTHQLTRHGISICFEADDNELVRHIKLAFDEIELEFRSYRQKQANRARAIKGHVTCKRPAYGYQMSEDGRTYVVDEERAYVVQMIFDWYTAGRTLRWIAAALTERGIPTPRDRKLRWRLETVRKILTHEVYRGHYIANRYSRQRVWKGGKRRVDHTQRPESEWIYVSVPSIVTERQWDEVQRKLVSNKKQSLRNSRKHEWLLSGLVRCACGHAVCCKHKRNPRRLASGVIHIYEYDYYRCSDNNRANAPFTCTQSMIARHRLEKLVLDALELLILRPDLWEQALDDNRDQVDRLMSQAKFLQSQILELDQQLEELLQIALSQRTLHTRQLFQEKQAELEKLRTGYETQLRITQEHLNLAEHTANRKKVAETILAELHELGGLQGLPFDVQRRLLTSLVDELVLNTCEQWFEIRGVLSDRFCYADDGPIASTSGWKTWWQ